MSGTAAPSGSWSHHARRTASRSKVDDDQIAFPVADRGAFGNFGGSLIEQAHVGDLVVRGDAAALPFAPLTAGAELAGERTEDAGEQRLIDRLGAGAHRVLGGKPPLQEPRDLLR
jgi:hypothetical protein